VEDPGALVVCCSLLSPSRHSLRAMTSSLDSAAVFADRLRELGLADIGEAMAEKGWSTMGSFAFAVPPSAQGVDYGMFESRVITPLLGAADAPRASALLRLHFEAHTVAVAEMRRRPVCNGHGGAVIEPISAFACL
jgi:hypothetical protein